MNTEIFKAKLEEEKKQLETEMPSVGRRNPAVPNDWEAIPAETGAEPDPVDQAEALTSQEDNVAILTDLESRYDEVLAALERINKGIYGKCKVDGEPIEETRLNADPAALTCIKHL